VNKNKSVTVRRGQLQHKHVSFQINACFKCL